MPRASKRARNCKDMRAAKKRKTEDEEDWVPPGLRPSATGHWEDLQLNNESGDQPEGLLSDSESDSEEVEMTDDEKDDLPFDGCAFETLLTGSQKDRVFENAVFPYQRGPASTLRSQQMKRKAERELAQSAEGSKKIRDFFPPVPVGENDGSSAAVTIRPVIPQPKEKEHLKWQEDIRALQKRLQSKKQRAGLNGETLTRYEAVCSFFAYNSAGKRGKQGSCFHRLWHSASTGESILRAR